MASGSQNMTTYNAKHIIGDSTNVNWAGALLHNGTDGKTNNMDTWIFADDYGSAAAPWGIKHDQVNNDILFIGSGTTNVNIHLGSSKVTATTFDGNANTATKLHTARAINGTDFDGSAAITTTNWGTARNITIKDASSTNAGTAVSVNGSAAVTLLLPSTIKASITGNCSGSSGSCTGNAATATNADKVDNYHASDLWRKDGGTWNGNANIACTPTANGQEYSFDLGNAYTGTYWHVWSGKNSKSILVCYNDNMNVSVPNGTLSAKAFSGPLTGNVTGNCSGSSGSCTGNAATATTASYLSPPNVAAYTTDGDGNFTHKRNTTGDYWHLNKNDGGATFSVYWETGNVTAAGTMTANGGYLKSTANSNTVTIGSQNTSYTHIYNSANIPFIFNNTVESTNGDLGTTSYPWHNIYIGPSNGAGIYYKGTNNTYRMIRFIDNASDIYGNGISIGGGGLAVFGAGESADTILSNLDLAAAGGTETTYIGSDGSIEFYPSINSWDASARIWMTAGVLNIGVDGNTTRENSLNVYSGAGRLQLYSAASKTGNRGLWVPAHGSGSSKNIIVIDTNNNATFTGNVTGDCSGSSGSCTGNAATATNLVGISMTGGNGNTGGRRLIYTWTINAWSNHRLTFAVSSRHTGSGLVAVSVGCNSSTVSLANCYAEIKYFGPTSSGGIISATSYEIYINSAGTKAYLFWQYTDYNDTSITPISGGLPSNGTWTENPASYGTLKAQTEINVSSTCYGNAATATKATQDGSGNTITDKYFQIYNTDYQGNSSSVTVNDLASQGPAYGMIYAATDNPVGSTGWVHVLNMAWGKTNTSWIGQIALSTSGNWIKFRGNGSGAISGAAWKTCCDLESTQNFTGNKSWGSNGAGGILYGNATNGGVNSIRIGDDVYLGDCNAGGIMGMKSTGTNCGFYMYNSSGTQIGQLYFNGTNLVCNKTISANITGSSGSCTGNAATATTANGLASLVTSSRANHSADTGVIVKNTDSTNPLTLGYIIGTSGNGGIYDFTHGVWKVQIAPNGTTTFNGNAATATKLGTANKGSTNHPIYLSGGTPTECHYPVSGNWYSAVPFIHSDGMMEIGRYIDFHGTSNMTGDHTIRFTCATNTARIDCNGVFAATGWSDLAEYRRTIEHEPGRAVIPTDCGIARRATGRLQPGARIVSDTYGFCLGESDDEQSPIALTGRVLAYPCRPISEYHAGDAVCSGPNGTVDLMTREEIQKYPDCIIGIVNEIPTYPIWNPKHTDDRQKVVFNENVEVRGRIWIDVK